MKSQVTMTDHLNGQLSNIIADGFFSFLNRSLSNYKISEVCVNLIPMKVT